MSTRSKSTSSLLIICLVVFTFPLWIGIMGALIGIAAGLFGGMVGIAAGAFGIIIGLVALPFNILFGWGHGSWFPHFHFHGFLTFAIVVLIVALLVKNRK